MEMHIEWRAGRHAEVTAPIDHHERSDRSGAGSQESTFAQLLTAAGQRDHAVADTYGNVPLNGGQTARTVRSGDTLSHLVQGVLRQAGQRVSRGELYRAVSLVAKANRLTDPDRLRPGQTIDLSAVASDVKKNERNTESSHDGAGEGIGEAAAGIMQGLKSFMQSFAGRFTSSFGPRADPVTGLRAFHAGVDIRMPTGSLIYPALPGRVAFSGRTLGYGNLIILSHANGFTTSYGHNTSNLIPAGVMVDQEMPIAIVGATGKATGPHLHFEVRKDGHPINPDLGSLDL